MTRKVVITISREYGSGGREVGRFLAEKLQIPYYDKELLARIYEKTGINEDIYEKVKENISQTNFYLGAPTKGFMTKSGALGELAIHDRLYLVQKKVIMEAAQKSCVIIGRCSDYILQDDPDVVRVYIHAKIKDRVERAINSYKESPENISQTLLKIDTDRANYYNYFTNQVWGKLSNYDLVINTSKVSLEKAADVIDAYIHARK